MLGGGPGVQLSGATHLVLLLSPAQEAFLSELLVVGTVVGLHLPGKCCGGGEGGVAGAAGVPPGTTASVSPWSLKANRPPGAPGTVMPISGLELGKHQAGQGSHWEPGL